MTRVCVMLIVFTTAVMHVRGALRTCSKPDSFRNLKTNKQLQIPAMDSVQEVGLVRCAVECKLRNKCRSFSFQHSTGECKMFGTAIIHALESIVIQSGTDISDIDDWPSRIAGPCANHACSDNEICQPTDQNGTTCVTAYCPLPPNVPYVKHNFNTSTPKVGSQLFYKCVYPYLGVGTRVCLANGTWSDFSCVSACNMFRLKRKFVLICFNTSRTCNEAQADCARYGDLLDVNTEQDHDALKALMQGNQYWIGLTDLSNRSVWTWRDGTSLTYDNWAPGSPVAGKRYVVWDQHGQYRTLDCEEEHLYACRVHIISCPTSQGFVHIVRDSLEVCFKVFSREKTLRGARDVCKLSRGRLIVLETAEKNMAVSEHINNTLGADTYLVGLTHRETEGLFMWEGGQVANFTNWMFSGPVRPRSHCVLLVSDSAQWKHASCAQTSKFVCEQLPQPFAG